jgi:hypothetical protein
MVAIEHGNLWEASHRLNPRSRVVGLMAGVAAGVLIAWISFLFGGADLNAARGASTEILLAASFVFVAYYVAAPISRLFRSDIGRTIGEERFALAYAFAGMMAVFITCILTPDTVSGARIPLPSLTYAVMTVLVGAVFLLSAGNKRADGSVTLRTFQSLSSGYFWLLFAFSNLDHMVGPHRPDDNPYGLSLLLLVLALIVRFADAFMLRLKAGASKRAI